MGLYKLSVTILYWLDSEESPEKKTIEIIKDHFANTHVAARRELDRLLLNKRAELEKLGYNVRYEKWKIDQL
ncbi:MAG TPA: hypothetical protein VMZ69_10505 [Saprospiraceae bacterium]|nr:hypothetical protein [Saprospiraceae bacterium]